MHVEALVRRLGDILVGAAPVKDAVLRGWVADNHVQLAWTPQGWTTVAQAIEALFVSPVRTADGRWNVTIPGPGEIAPRRRDVAYLLRGKEVADGDRAFATHERQGALYRVPAHKAGEINFLCRGFGLEALTPLP